MNNRIRRFMEYKGISSSEFADHIGVQRSNVTHILHGRNKPGFQFISKMLGAYPDLDAKWLLTGDGKMLETGTGPAGKTEEQPALFRHVASPAGQEGNVQPEKSLKEEKGMPDSVQPMPEILRQVNAGRKREIESIVIFYSDQTFGQYIPSK